MVEKALEHRALVAENRVLRHRVGERQRARRGDPGRVARHPGGAAARGEGRAHPHHRPHHRRERHRQGGGGARHPRRGARARARPFVADQLRAPSREAARERALRAREGRLHRRGRRQARACSRWPTAARSSSTRSASCRSTCRRSSCACSRSGRFERVGGSAAERTSTCASSPPPTATSRDEVQAGTLPRGPLLPPQRHPDPLPPLRERREDIPAFLDLFLARFAEEQARKIRPRLDPETRRLLLAHGYPGNVRRAGQPGRALRHPVRWRRRPPLDPAGERPGSGRDAGPGARDRHAGARRARPAGAPRRPRAEHPGAGAAAHRRSQDGGGAAAPPDLPIAPLSAGQVRDRRRVAPTRRWTRRPRIATAAAAPPHLQLAFETWRQSCVSRGTSSQ